MVGMLLWWGCDGCLWFFCGDKWRDLRGEFFAYSGDTLEVFEGGVWAVGVAFGDDTFC